MAGMVQDDATVPTNKRQGTLSNGYLIKFCICDRGSNLVNFLGVRHYCYEGYTKHAKHAKARGVWGHAPPRKF